MSNKIEHNNRITKKINRKVKKVVQSGALALGLVFLVGDQNTQVNTQNQNKIEQKIQNNNKSFIKPLKEKENIEIVELNITEHPFYLKDRNFGFNINPLNKRVYNRDEIKFEDGEDVYFNRQPGILEKGWKYDSDGFIYKYYKGKKYIVKGITNYHIFKENEIDICQYSEIINILPEIKYIVRRDLYLKKHSTLSKSDFDLFFNKKELTDQSGQKNTGNCFLIASFRTLMESPNYEALIRTSVKYDKKEKKFEINLPLGSPKSTTYIVYESDLCPQKNPFFNPIEAIPPQTVPCQKVKRDNDNKKYVAQFYKDGKTPIITKGPMFYKPMEAPKGLQALEVAYLRCYTGDICLSFDRGKMSSGGQGDEALRILLGENDSKELWIKMEGNEDKAGFFKFLDNYNPYTTYATINSLCRPGKTDSNSYKIEGLEQELYYGHSYAIIGTNPILRTVTIINPRHLNEPIELTYEQAFEGFYRVKGAKPDFEKGFKYFPFY